MIFYDGGKRQRERGTHSYVNFSTFSSGDKEEEEPPQIILNRNKKKKNKKNKKQKKQTKKNKKSCSMRTKISFPPPQKILSLFFPCAALRENTNGPLLLRGAKRGEDEQHEQQQKQRSDQRTLRITLKPRPETRGREIRVRGFECDEERWENQAAPAVYQSWEFRVASSRCKRRPPRGEEIRKERESKRNE